MWFEYITVYMRVYVCLQLIEQALVVEEQLRKSVSENPGLIEPSAMSRSSQPTDKFVSNCI